METIVIAILTFIILIMTVISFAAYAAMERERIKKD